MADRMLTRDERHMLGAALDVLRANVRDEPGRRGGIAWYALIDASMRLEIAEDYGARVKRRAWWAALIREAERHVEWSPAPSERRRRERILRARLALAIRAVLRADRGERGQWWAMTPQIGREAALRTEREAREWALFFVGTVRRREALWAVAPSHEAGGEGR